jgi:hypothetical protein
MSVILRARVLLRGPKDLSLLDCRAPALCCRGSDAVPSPTPVILSAVWRRAKRIARRSRRTCCSPPVPPALRGVPSRLSVQAKLIASVILRVRVLLRGPKDLSLPDCRAPALRCRRSDPVPSTTPVILSAVWRRAKRIARRSRRIPISFYCRRQCKEFSPVQQDDAIIPSDDDLIEQA